MDDQEGGQEYLKVRITMSSPLPNSKAGWA